MVKKNLPANAGDSGCKLIQEDPTCRRATELVHRNYSASALEPRNLNSWVHALQVLKAKRSRACTLQQEMILQEEVHVSQLESATTRDKYTQQKKTQHSQKNKKKVLPFFPWGQYKVRLQANLRIGWTGWFMF